MACGGVAWGGCRWWRCVRAAAHSESRRKVRVGSPFMICICSRLMSDAAIFRSTLVRVRVRVRAS